MSSNTTLYLESFGMFQAGKGCIWWILSEDCAKQGKLELKVYGAFSNLIVFADWPLSILSKALLILQS